MRIIFSRKGFDAANGGVASPIFPDGSFCSLPIPSEEGGRLLGGLRFGNYELSQLVWQLSPSSNLAESLVHLDPDLNEGTCPRAAAWRPCFGQAGAAQTHLRNQGVGEGDIFLFFGWFREIKVSERVGYLSEAPDIHALFGWLQIGDIYHPRPGKNDVPKWASEHPHVKAADHYYAKGKNNTLYVASNRLSIPGLDRSIAGGGIFPNFYDRLQLTKPGETRSFWRLPRCFYPSEGRLALSYHNNKNRWELDPDGVVLRTVGRGQEFVLDLDHCPEVFAWLRDVFEIAPESCC